jgi:hypothetical protein
VGRIHTGAGAAAEDRGFSSTEERAMAFGVRRPAEERGRSRVPAEERAARVFCQ